MAPFAHSRLRYLSHPLRPEGLPSEITCIDGFGGGLFRLQEGTKEGFPFS